MFPEEDAADVQFVGRGVGYDVYEDIIGEGFSTDVEFIGKVRGGENGK